MRSGKPPGPSTAVAKVARRAGRPSARGASDTRAFRRSVSTSRAATSDGAPRERARWPQAWERLC